MSNVNSTASTQLIQQGSKHFVKDPLTGRLVEVERSCEMCRKRKKKCSKTSPCTTCLKFQLECVYKPKEEKTPLTRARMTTLENNIGKITKILKNVVDDKPTLEAILLTYGLKKEDLDKFEDFSEDMEEVNVNIPANDSSLKKNENESKDKATNMEKSDSSINSANMNDRSEELKLLKQIKNKVKKIKRNGIKGQERIQISDTIQSDVPNDELNGFNWIEIDDYDLKNKNDGMAALSVNPNNKGYFGQGSTANMLRKTLLISENDTERGGSICSSEMIKVTRELANELRSFEVRESLVNSYFAHYHTSYPFLDRDWFLRKFMASKNCDECNSECKPLEEILNKEDIDNNALKQAIEDEDWKILLNTVCALGAWCLQGEVAAMANMDLFYYKEAKNLINGVLFERGSIPLVTAFTLMSNYTQKRDKPNTGWNYLGIASRMAIGLGLYKELGGETTLKTNTDVIEQRDLNLEIRRRLWWGLYMFDVGTAITFGRPVNFPVSANFDIRLPKNMDECGCELKDTPTIYTGLIEQTKFTSISLDIHSKLLSSQPPSSKECLKLNEKIEEFVQSLPKWFNKDSKIAFPCCEQILIDDIEMTQNGAINLEKQTNNKDASGKSKKHNINTNDSKNLKLIPQWFHLTRYRLIWRVLNLQILMLQNFVWQDIMGRNESRYMNYIRTHPSMKKCITTCLDSCAQSIESVKEFIDSITKNKKYDIKKKQLVSSDYQHFITSPNTIMEALGEATKQLKNTPQSLQGSLSNSNSATSLKHLPKLKSPINMTKDAYSNSRHGVLASLSTSDYSNTTGSNSPELSTKPHISMLASWYATYFLFQATIVPMVCLIYNDENCNLLQWNSWKKQVNTARECFKILSESNKTAADFLKIVDDMCGSILKEESAAPFSPSTSKANSDAVQFTKETSPYAIGSVYNNNNIFDANGKLKAENTNFAVGTPFDKDFKMNINNSNNNYFVNRGTPATVNNFALTTPYISKGTTSDIRESNSRPTTPSILNLIGNDQQKQIQFNDTNSNRGSNNNNIFTAKDTRDQFAPSPLNTFDLMGMEASDVDGKIDFTDEPEDDNLFGFGRGMGLEALATHGSNTNLNSLLNIFGEAGVSSFMDNNGNKGVSVSAESNVDKKKNKVNQGSNLKTVTSLADILNNPKPTNNNNTNKNNTGNDNNDLFAETTADGLVIPELAHTQFPKRINKKK